MPVKPIILPVPFPFLGVDRGAAASTQPKFTTYDLLNVRAMNYGDAMSGGKREGITKAFSTQTGVDPGGTVADPVTGQSAESTWRRINEINLFIATSTGVVVPCELVDIGTGLGANGYRLLEHPADTLNIVGDYTTAGGNTVERFAQLTVSSDAWIDPGVGFSGSANPVGLCLFNDGVHGDEMYCAGATGDGAHGDGSGKLSVYRGGVWVDVDGSGFGGTAQVNCCVVHDGNLYVGGKFTTANGVTCNCVAKWDYNAGTPTFHALTGVSGTGVTGSTGVVYAMESHAGALYVAGIFTSCGGFTCQNIGKWTGVEWSVVTDGVNTGVGLLADITLHAIFALRSWNGLLYIGGNFDRLSGAAAGNGAINTGYELIIAWNASLNTYNRLIWGLRDRGGNGGDTTGVKAIEIYDDGTGEKLWVFGSFQAASTSDSYGLAAPNVAFWDGTIWGVPDKGVNVNAIGNCIYHGIGAGSATPKKLFMVGNFTRRNVIAANGLASFDGAAMAALGGAGACHRSYTAASVVSGSSSVVGNSIICAGTLVNDPVERLYAALKPSGSNGFYGYGPSFINTFAAKLTLADSKSMWEDLKDAAGKQPGAACYAMVIWNGKLYMGGAWVANAPIRRGITAWNGTGWDSLSAAALAGGFVSGLCVHDDGGGEDLYVLESVSSDINGVAGTGWVARYNGSAWSSLTADATLTGTGPSCCVSFNGKLYIGGTFTMFKSVTVNNVCAWNGTAFVTVGQGTGGGFNGAVNALCVYNNELYAAGVFTSANSVTMNGIAKYNTATDTWETLGDGFTAGEAGFAMHVWNGRLYIGGNFSTCNGTAMPCIAAWDGTSFTPLDETTVAGLHSYDGVLAGDVQALTIFNNQLAIAGQFDYIGGDVSTFLTVHECV